VHEIGKASGIQMSRVISQKGFHKLPESQIKEKGSTVRSRSSAHLSYLKVGHLPNDFVNGKILSRRKMGQADGINHQKHTHDCTATGITDHEILVWLELVQVCKAGAMDSGSFWFAESV
jgi:hypothetical protein